MIVGAAGSRSERVESEQNKLTADCQAIMDYVTKNLQDVEGAGMPNESVAEEVCFPCAPDDIYKSSCQHIKFVMQKNKFSFL